MAQSRVYVETTIPSFYHEARMDPEAVARRNWTRRWWDKAQADCRLVTSEAVLLELSRAPTEYRHQRLTLIENVPLLPIVPEIIEIVAAYIHHKVMPADPGGDALHLAVASFHNCDFLVTWNCRHIANANKFGHIRRINVLLGLSVPALVTPLEMLGVDDGTSPT